MTWLPALTEFTNIVINKMSDDMVSLILPEETLSSLAGGPS